MEPLDPYDPSTPGYQRELGYAPCRDDDCRDGERTHPKHEVSPRVNGRIPRTCPACLTKLEAPDQNGLLTCPKLTCSWTRQTKKRKRGRPGRPRKVV